MENSIYNSMISAIQLLDQQAVISNNLANISTIGFKEKFNFLVNDQANDINKIKNLSNKNIQEYYNFSSGLINHTGRNLDIFIKDDGWLVVKDINGEEAYTKNGHLKINKNKKLTVQNYELVGNNCNIVVPNNSNLKILSNGSIIASKKNHNIFTENKIGSLKLVRPSIKNLIQKNNGLFYFKNTGISHQNKIKTTHNSDVTVQSGMLEISNVSATKNIINMISNARQFEMQMKMISILDQNAERANQLLNINS